MKDLRNLAKHYLAREHHLWEAMRGNPPPTSFDRAFSGVFMVPSTLDGGELRILADRASALRCNDWDHVSVSRTDRCPAWEEMDQVKRLFFKDSEVAMQLHVAPRNHVNVHPYCLHLWRPLDGRIPLPPIEYVA
jgi:hypothetical protein